MATRPAVSPADLLLLVFRHLRRRGLSAAAVALLRESGVDPFWLCGPSRELFLLRESVFTGDFPRARALLAPLHAHLPPDQLADAMGELGKLQVLERAFDDAGDRRQLLQLLRKRAHAGGETLQPANEHDSLPFLRTSNARECLAVLQAASTPTTARWDRLEARLHCFEVLVRAFRDEIDPSEREHKYEAVSPEQLEWLVQDALLFHGRSDCIALRTRAASMSATDCHSHDESDALYLSPPQTESPEEVQPRTNGRTASVMCSVDCLPTWPLATASAPPLRTPTGSGRERRRHPLVASMDASRLLLLREEEAASHPVLRRPEAAVEVPNEPHGVDAGTSTEPPTAPATVDIEATACVEVEEASTQTEAEEPASDSREEAEGIAKPMPHAWEDDPPLEANQADDGDGDALHQDSDDDDNRVDGDDVEDQSEGLDLDGDADDGYDRPDAAPEDAPRSPLGYDQLAVEHIVRARVVAEDQEAHAVRAMDVHRSGGRLAIGTNARALRLLDVSSAGRSDEDTAFAHHHHLPLLPVVSEWHKHQRAPIYCVAWSHETWSAPLVASGDADGSIKVLRLPSVDQRVDQRADKHAGDNSGGAVAWSGRHEGKLRALRFASGESSLLWSAASGDRSLRCWDVSHALPSSLVALDGHVGEIHALALAPAGSSWLASAAADRTLRLWDARSGRCERLLASGLPHAALVLDFHPRRADVVAAGHQDGSVSLWDLRGATFASAAWGPPTRGASAALVSVARPHQDECRAVAWAPGGRWLLSGSFDGSVCFLSARAALEPVASFRQHRDKVLQALWHPTAPAIVTSGADKRVKLWRLG